MCDIPKSSGAMYGTGARVRAAEAAREPALAEAEDWVRPCGAAAREPATGTGEAIF
jgi:hypothetical protein